jgi:hypothetical protein
MLATVVDAAGRTLVDLGSDDFLISEHGEAREVLSVHPADYPIVLLLDTAASPADVNDVRLAAVRFLARIGAERPVAIGTLADPSALVATFDDDRETVLAALGQVGVGANRDPIESIAASGRRLAEAEIPFSAITVIAGPTAHPEASAARADLLNAISGTRSRVHAVARGDNDSLREITGLTNGLFIRIFSAASYQSALDRLADAFAAEFMVQYLVPASAPAPDDVRVGVRRPGARVLVLGVAP